MSGTEAGEGPMGNLAPSLDEPAAAGTPGAGPIVAAQGVRKTYDVGGVRVEALRQVDLDGGRFLRADLPGGRTESPGVTARNSPLWQPQDKVACRFLSAALRGEPAGGRLADRDLSPEAPAR